MPTFQDVTGRSGLNYTGRNYSAVWGDANGDGLPDLWVSKHNSHATVLNAEDGSLYQNLGNGRFANVTPQRVEYIQRDMHGAAWGDFDNDGDPDLVQVTGGSSKGGITLYENVGGNLQIATDAHGLTFTNNTVGRGVLWMDYNRDGLLDIWLGADQVSTGGTAGGKSTVFRQTPSGTFVDAGAAVGVNVTNATSPVLADLNGDNNPELVLTNYGVFSRIYNTAVTPWVNIQGSLFNGLNIPIFNDIAIADFNNDGRSDIFIARNGISSEVAFDGQRVKFWMAEVPEGEQDAFSFRTTGNVTFNFSTQDGTIRYSSIKVGATGYQPLPGDNVSTMTLSPNNPANIGMPAHDLETRGAYIGYDPIAQQWRCEIVGSVKVFRGGTITSTEQIRNLQTEGFPLNPTPAQNQLLINTVTGSGVTRFVDQSQISNIADMRIFGNHVVAGDFDNDGWVDLYVDQAGEATNRPNVLLHNLGNARFQLIPNGDGAPGPTVGTGGTLAVADYDRDGFLDLLSTNGGGEPPFMPLNLQGSMRLYHNLGNSNHWLELRLHGTQSNADGIGAKVFITAGGQQQMREWVGGQHIKGQDFHDVHFGLGQNTVIDRLEVQWPSGAVTVRTNVPVDSLLHIQEGPGPANAADQLGFLSLPSDDMGVGLTFDSSLSDFFAGNDASATDSHTGTIAEGVALDLGALSDGLSSGDWLLS